MLVSCEYQDRRFKVINVSNKLVYYSVIDRDSMSNVYDERLEELDIHLTYQNYVDSISPSTVNLEMRLGGKNEWEKYVNNGDNQRVYVFTFDADTLKKYSWGELLKVNYYEKRLDYNLEELNKMNWEVKLR